MEWRTLTSPAFMPAESRKESCPEEATTKDATNDIPVQSITGGVGNRRKMCTGLIRLGKWKLSLATMSYMDQNVTTQKKLRGSSPALFPRSEIQGSEITNLFTNYITQLICGRDWIELSPQKPLLFLEGDSPV